MRDFRDRVAVITGAASGIGRGLAQRAAREGMRLVLADIEEQPLAQATAELEAAGARVLPIVTDVSRAGDLAVLADRTRSAYGACHLLCNNAGVGVYTTIADSTLADWQWVLGVNLWGVIHGIQAFLPWMLEQESESHMVNTASEAGLVSPPYMGLYNVSKHGVVTLSETLYRELLQRRARVKVSVLCPGFVQTRIMESMRNRPSATAPDPPAANRNQEKVKAILTARVETGLAPGQVADRVFEALREDRFYIFTGDEFKPAVEDRLKDLLLGRNPSLIG
jgi:NAD(P)-dependent dehydrogenase (short-subunit alcohol dehydrogenase family)